MDERLGRDHAVEQLAARVACAGNDSTVGFGRFVIERERRHSGKDGVETRAPYLRMGGLPIDAAFEFDAGDDRHQHGIVERGHFLRHRRIAVAQMNGDIGVEQERHDSETPPLRQFLIVPPLDAGRRGQGAQALDHRGDGRGGRIDRHHVAGADDDEFDVFTEGNVLRQANGFAVAASEGSSSSDRHLDSQVYTRIYYLASAFARDISKRKPRT